MRVRRLIFSSRSVATLTALRSSTTSSSVAAILPTTMSANCKLGSVQADRGFGVIVGHIWHCISESYKVVRGMRDCLIRGGDLAASAYETRCLAGVKGNGGGAFSLSQCCGGDSGTGESAFLCMLAATAAAGSATGIASSLRLPLLLRPPIVLRRPLALLRALYATSTLAIGESGGCSSCDISFIALACKLSKIISVLSRTMLGAQLLKPIQPRPKCVRCCHNTARNVIHQRY